MERAALERILIQSCGRAGQRANCNCLRRLRYRHSAITCRSEIYSECGCILGRRLRKQPLRDVHLRARNPVVRILRGEEDCREGRAGDLGGGRCGKWLVKVCHLGIAYAISCRVGINASGFHSSSPIFLMFVSMCLTIGHGFNPVGPAAVLLVLGVQARSSRRAAGHVL